MNVNDQNFWAELINLLADAIGIPSNKVPDWESVAKDYEPYAGNTGLTALLALKKELENYCWATGEAFPRRIGGSSIEEATVIHGEAQKEVLIKAMELTAALLKVPPPCSPKELAYFSHEQTQLNAMITTSMIRLINQLRNIMHEHFNLPPIDDNRIRPIMDDNYPGSIH